MQLVVSAVGALAGGCLPRRGAGTVLWWAAAKAGLCAQGLGQSRRSWPSFRSLCLGGAVGQLPGAKGMIHDEPVSTMSLTPGAPDEAFRGKIGLGSV